MSTSTIIAVVAVLALVAVLRRSRSASPDIDLETATEADLRSLVMAGRKIDAIKVYRRLHDVDLKDAKAAVERLAKELPPTIH